MFPFKLQKRDAENENINLRGLILAIGLWAVAIALMWIGDKGLPDLLIGVGGGLVSSVAVVFIYSRFAEEISLTRISERSAKIATQVAEEFLIGRFDQLMPRKTYAKSTAPTNDFRNDFAPKLKSSKFYFHRGDGSFSAFRLYSTANIEAIRTKIRVSLCLLDPNAVAAIDQRAKIELDAKGNHYSADQLKERVARVRMSTYVSLVALFDIRHTRPVEVFLHQESSFYRAEILDDSLFVTYYIGGEFPGTYLYGKESHVYQAYLSGFNAICACASRRIEFNSNFAENQFSQILTELGYSGTLLDLRKERDDSYALRTQSLPFPATDVF